MGRARHLGANNGGVSLRGAAEAIPVYVGVGLVPTLIGHCMAARQSCIL
ncbi:MAG TPA: hypothetical protein PLS77_13770 [Anaerolineaceae bacterium]|nr:hypothetical protein [Anaerolineaceae bacterium]